MSVDPVQKMFCNGRLLASSLSCPGTISRKMEFPRYFSYLLIAETLLLVAGQSLHDYGLNAGQREAVKRTGMINLNFETSKNTFVMLRR